MPRELLKATFLYLITIVILLAGLYLFLEKNGFSKSNFMVGSLLVLCGSIALGYLFNEYILTKKFEIDKNLLHITKEILHELNIPISTIQANSKLLKRTLEGEEKSMIRLSRIDASTVRLERLYRELNYSIKKEIYLIEKESFDLKVLLLERVAALKLLKRNEFVLALESSTIYVDKIGFEKALDNILVNAMKYSSKDTSIQVSLEDKILTIEDNGVGMDETELVKIYERYYQLDNKVHGEGIGLALVKAYCDDEKIDIHIASTKGIGTKVTFDLTAVISH